MEKENTLHIVTVSGACCMPHMARLDQVVEKNLQEAIGQLGVAAQVRQISLSAILAGKGDLSAKQREQIQSLFQLHGARFAPAILINDQVRFISKPPTTEQLKEALQSAASPQS